MRAILAGLLMLFPLVAQTADEKEIVAVVQKVFAGMAANDSTMILGAMTPDAHLYGVRPTGEPYSMPATDWAGRLAASKSKFDEHFTKTPTVTVHQTIANVWGEYDFLRDGKFGHCGVDSFNLIKTASGWKVAAIFDTEESTGCAAQAK
jgi:hypothetical protein